MKLYHIKMMLKRNKLIKGMYDKLIGNRKAVLEEQKKRQALRDRGLELLVDVEDALRQTPAEFFMNSGSLLGMVRDGKFIAHDNDIDFGIYIDERFGWEDLEAALCGHGFRKSREFSYAGERTEQTYCKGDLTVDFFRHYETETDAYSYFYYRTNGYLYDSPKHYHAARVHVYKFAGTKILTVGGISFHAPSEPEKYLESRYGKGWKVPDPNWEAGDDPATEHLKEALGLVEYFK